MFHYCLNRDQIFQVIQNLIESETINDENNLSILLEMAQYWHLELISINYLLSQILERCNKQGKDSVFILNEYYGLQNNLWLNIEEYNEAFINYLMRNLRDKNLSLEEDLIQIQEKYREYEY